MEKESLTLHDIAREVQTPGYRKRAQQRAKRRKSPWNLILVLFMFGAGYVAYRVLFQCMWQIHLVFYPAHIKEAAGFWEKKISLSSFLLSMPLLFVAMLFGMMATNCIAWLILPARQVLDREATGVKGASFSASMRGLWLISRIVIPVCLLFSFIGAITWSG